MEMGVRLTMLYLFVLFCLVSQVFSIEQHTGSATARHKSHQNSDKNKNIVHHATDDLAPYHLRSYPSSLRHKIKAGASAEHATTLNNVALGSVVLVSTIEGGIYGLHRDTGSRIWSLPPRTSSNETGGAFAPLLSSTFGPEMRTFSELAADMTSGDESYLHYQQGQQPTASGQEALEAIQDLGLYIVEPSDGHIYVLSRPRDGSSPTKLSKLPLSLPQLVDLGPFSFPGDASRVFAGHKRTTLVEIDVLTGRIGAVFGDEGAHAPWCPATPDPDTAARLDRQEDFCQRREQWAHIGRTDYTLTIHLRGRPSLSQTLRYSTFTPDIADRDLATMWSRRATTLDQRALLGMPEEGTIVCFNSSAAFEPTSASVSSNKERTLWVSELGATVAGIFDIIYPHTNSDSEPQLGEEPLGKAVIVPHPRRALPPLYLTPSAASQDTRDEGPDAADEAEETSTYLGLSGGHLYAMGQREYPLIAFARQAPVSLGHASHQDNHHHSSRSYRGIEAGFPSLCTSSSCFVGTYDLAASGNGGAMLSGDRMLGGSAPLLGIGDGSKSSSSSASDNDRLPNDTESGIEADTRSSLSSSSSSSSSPSSSSSSPSSSLSSLERSWSTLPSPTMLLAQMIVVLLLAVLCGLVYVGAQEQRRQNAEQANAASKELLWAPVAQNPAPDTTLASATRAEVKTKTGEEAEGNDGLNDAVALEGRTLLEDGEDVAVSEGKPGDKRRAAKRRRRGKRAGAAVLQREGRREANGTANGRGEEGEDQSDNEEYPQLDNGHLSATDGVQNQMDAGAALASPTTMAISQSGWLDTGENTSGAGGQEAIKIAAQASLRAEGGEATTVEEGGVAKRGKSLVISDEVLGYGSSGTIVFKGTFQGRAVAVKRLLRDFVDVASKEVSLLESADNHPNVIRYFYKEVTSTFLFIALELCPASLADVIERPAEWQELCAMLKPKRCLWQIASGVHHLHSLSIVHRDIKPQNILVTYSPGGKLKMLLSDFGLSKRLDGIAQTSFSQTMNNPGGTVGWRAPEILRGDVSLDESREGSSSSTTTTSASDSITATGENHPSSSTRARLTRAIDVFALGCLTYYVLSNGEHPFGSRYEREVNIIRNRIDLSRLDSLGEEGHEAQHVVRKMVEMDPRDRLTAHQVMAHPYFWDPSRRLAFLQDASDKFDNMEREPPAPALVALEDDSAAVLGGGDWLRKIDRQVLEDLSKRRKYDGKRVVDLLRAIRNKKHHIHDLSPQLRRLFGTTADSFLAYFTSRFPKLFLHTYSVVESSKWLKSDPSFAPYFQPAETDP